MKNTRDIPSNDAIAFARNCFETLAIEDFDVAAPIGLQPLPAPPPRETLLRQPHPHLSPGLLNPSLGSGSFLMTAAAGGGRQPRPHRQM